MTARARSIPIGKLHAVRTIVTHGYPDGGVCPDGLASALLCRDALPDAKVVFAVYNTSEYESLPVEEHMLFVDMTPPAARADEFRRAGTIVLDHHKDKEALVASFGELGVFADETREPGVSGAVLAYEHVWRPLVLGHPARQSVSSSASQEALLVATAHDFAMLAGIRDTWQTRSPRWQEACEQAAVLLFFSPDDWLSHPWLSDEARLSERMKLGSTIIERHRKESEALVKDAYRFTTPDGTRVMVLASTKISDAAEASKDAADVVVGFSFTASSPQGPMMRLSFRSKTKDVSAFARLLGGGGHTGAAGAAVPLGDHTVDRGDNAHIAANPYAFIHILIPQLEENLRGSR